MSAPNRVDRWRRSSHSGTGNNCVEVANLGGQVGVRDSKDPGGGIVHLPAALWRSLAGRVKDGDYDV